EGKSRWTGAMGPSTAAAPARHRPGAGPARRGETSVPQADFRERTRTMQTPSLLRRLFDCVNNSRARRPRRHAPTRLALEQLEDRTVPSTLQGTVFNDLNQDGIRDPGEPGIPNWLVYLDADQNGQYTSGEAYTPTDALGAYSFTGLPAD